MFGNFTAQAGVISNLISNSPNIIKPTLTWDFNNVLVMDFNPPGFENINDRPRINVWRDVNGTPDFNYLLYISGGKDVLSPAPTGQIVQPWGDRRTGIYTFPSTSITETYINNPYNLKQKLTGSQGFLGSSVDMNNDGTILILGVPGYNIRYSPIDIDLEVGAAFIYTGNSNNGWKLKQILSGDSASSRFGHAVSINGEGNVLLMSGPYQDNVNGEQAGAALVYTGNAVNGWQLKQKLTGENISGRFGLITDISNDGNILIINAQRHNETQNAGAAYVYTGNTVNGWQLKQQFTGTTEFENLGLSVASNMDGTVLIITNTNSAFVYTGNAMFGWKIKETLTGDALGVNYGFSSTINKEGKVLIIGDRLYDLDGFAPLGFRGIGAAYVYTGNAIDGWKFKQKLTGNMANSFFGCSLSINDDSTILTMGAYAYGENETSLGSVFIYTGSPNTSWQLNQQLIGDSEGDLFGASVSTSSEGNILLVSSVGDDDGGVSAGAASLFSITPTPKFEIIAGLDLFTHPFSIPKNISPPLSLWTINANNVTGEIQYQYKFKVGETNPQIFVELDYNSNCTPGGISEYTWPIPTCNETQSILYVGTGINGCPIFTCVDNPSFFTEIGSLYNSSNWISGPGKAGFGDWSFNSGNGSFRNISNSTQNGRQSIGDQSFFMVGSSGNINSHTGNFLLYNNLLSGESLSFNANYSWFAGSRIISILTGNSPNQFLCRTIHQNSTADALTFNRPLSVFGPQINTTITGNAFNKAFTYEIKNLGTGIVFNTYLYNQNAPLYSSLFTGNNINFNIVKGISFVTTLNNVPIQDWFNYGLYFNNIYYNNNQEINPLDGQYQVATSQFEAIFLSNNYGNNWSPYLVGAPPVGPIQDWRAGAISYNGEFLSIISRSGFIYCSNDYGNNWSQKTFTPRGWSDIAISHTAKYQTAVIATGLANSNFIDNNPIIFRSANSGESWSEVSIQENWIKVAMSRDGKYQTAVAFVGGGCVSNCPSGIYCSNNYGVTWTPKMPFNGWIGIGVNEIGQYQVAATIFGQIYVSQNYGESWELKYSDLGNKYFLDVDISNNGQYITAVVNGGQIYVSNNYGNSWTEKQTSDNPNNKLWYSVSINGNGKYQSATTFAGQLYISNDYGNTWNPKESIKPWFDINVNKYSEINDL